MMVWFFVSWLTEPEPVVDLGCKEDKECPGREACIIRASRGECRNPCTAFSPCVSNAECKVFSTLPLRTMTCTCVQGFTGQGDISCVKIRKCCLDLGICPSLKISKTTFCLYSWASDLWLQPQWRMLPITCLSQQRMHWSLCQWKPLQFNSTLWSSGPSAKMLLSYWLWRGSLCWLHTKYVDHK